MEFGNDKMTDPGANPQHGHPMQELMGRLGIQDPLIQQLITMLETDRETDAANAFEAVHDLPDGVEQGVRATARLQRENELLRQSNECLLEQSRMLASAIGACPECWGEDMECGFCEGEGKPGSFRPHRGCFEVFILPVVDALKSAAATRRRQKRPAPMQPEPRPPASQTPIEVARPSGNHSADNKE